jgi:hypothetical protein
VTARWRWWCVRAAVTFFAVFLLGLMNVPLQVAYLTAAIIVIADAARTAFAGGRTQSSNRD